MGQITIREPSGFLKYLAVGAIVVACIATWWVTESVGAKPLREFEHAAVVRERTTSGSESTHRGTAIATNGTASTDEIVSMRMPEEPSGDPNFQLVQKSGDTGGYVIEVKNDLGGFFVDCTERDPDGCVTLFGSYPDYTSPYLTDTDYAQCDTLGVAGQCPCQLCANTVRVKIRQIDTEDQSTFEFDPSELKGICGYAGNACTAFASEVRVKAYNNVVFQVHDIRNVHTGKVKIEGRYRWNGTGITSSPCQFKGRPPIDAWVTQGIRGAFSTTRQLALCNTPSLLTQVSEYAGLTPWANTANTNGGFSGGQTNWVTLSSGVCQDEDFRIGFEFLTELFGHVPNGHAGLLFIDLRFTAVQESCP